MWICVCGESAPTPGGMFVAHFTDCSLAFCGMFCVYFVGVRHVIAIRQQP